jgi:hypothetical protein
MRHHHWNWFGKKIYGTNGDDGIFGSNHSDTIFGFRGDDAIFAGPAMTPSMAVAATI